MRRIRETLRLHLQAGLSYNEVARALKISKSVVGKYVLLARVAGVDWAAADGLSDEALEARLYRPAVPRSSHQLAPDFGLIHQELKRAGVTLMLLWEEYATSNPLAYKYTSFCIKYRAFAATQQRSMRQVHIAGEKLFVDYAGSTVPVVDATTGEITQAQIFVATLGASNYTYACATPRQTTADWISAQVLALEFIGGTPKLIVPDQTRSLIKTPDRYDPEPNRTYEEFAKHYGCAVLAARPAHPRDKPKVEGSVLLVQRWILARLRNRRFFSLGELNAAIAELLVDLNQRPFKKLPGCRRSAFELLDAPALRPLPAARFVISHWKTAKVTEHRDRAHGGHLRRGAQQRDGVGRQRSRRRARRCRRAGGRAVPGHCRAHRRRWVRRRRGARWTRRIRRGARQGHPRVRPPLPSGRPAQCAAARTRRRSGAARCGERALCGDRPGG
jgi:transposase